MITFWLDCLGVGCRLVYLSGIPQTQSGGDLAVKSQSWPNWANSKGKTEGRSGCWHAIQECNQRFIFLSSSLSLSPHPRFENNPPAAETSNQPKWYHCWLILHAVICSWIINSVSCAVQSLIRIRENVSRVWQNDSCFGEYLLNSYEYYLGRHDGGRPFDGRMCPWLGSSGW